MILMHVRFRWCAASTVSGRYPVRRESPPERLRHSSEAVHRKCDEDATWSRMTLIAVNSNG